MLLLLWPWFKRDTKHRVALLPSAALTCCLLHEGGDPDNFPSCQMALLARGQVPAGGTEGGREGRGLMGAQLCIGLLFICIMS